MILKVVQQVAADLWRLVRPQLGKRSGASIVGVAQSGDYTYALDHDAEQALPEIVERAGRMAGLRVAYYSEDRGLVCPFDAPHYVLVIDPIDGTRPALCGLESCCISVAAAPMTDRHDSPQFRDLAAACLVEAQSGQVISAKRGFGVWIGTAQTEGESLLQSYRLLQGPRACSTTIDKMFWAYENAGRPLAATYQVLGDVINTSSHAGATFVMNSSSYAISRVLTGQLDAYVDVFAGLLKGPHENAWREHSKSLFKGRVFGLFAYDIAAAVLLAQETGLFVTDVFGKPLDSIALLDSSDSNLLNVVVACDETLGRSIIDSVRDGLGSAPPVAISTEQG